MTAENKSFPETIEWISVDERLPEDRYHRDPCQLFFLVTVWHRDGNSFDVRFAHFDFEVGDFYCWEPLGKGDSIINDLVKEYYDGDEVGYWAEWPKGEVK